MGNGRKIIEGLKDKFLSLDKRHFPWHQKTGLDISLRDKYPFSSRDLQGEINNDDKITWYGLFRERFA
jgi:hypothetical protein